MINIKLNGENRPTEPNATIKDLLTELNINNRYCAVECNLKLVPREKHEECTLQDGDRIEIVTLVGGG